MKCASCRARIVYPLVMCRPCWPPGMPNDNFVAEIMAAAKTVKVAE